MPRYDFSAVHCVIGVFNLFLFSVDIVLLGNYCVVSSAQQSNSVAEEDETPSSSPSSGDDQEGSNEEPHPVPRSQGSPVKKSGMPTTTWTSDLKLKLGHRVIPCVCVYIMCL